MVVGAPAHRLTPGSDSRDGVRSALDGPDARPVRLRGLITRPGLECRLLARRYQPVRAAREPGDRRRTAAALLSLHRLRSGATRALEQVRQPRLARPRAGAGRDVHPVRPAAGRVRSRRDQPLALRLRCDGQRHTSHCRAAGAVGSGCRRRRRGRDSVHDRGGAGLLELARGTRGRRCSPEPLPGLPCIDPTRSCGSASQTHTEPTASPI